MTILRTDTAMRLTKKVGRAAEAVAAAMQQQKTRKGRGDRKAGEAASSRTGEGSGEVELRSEEHNEDRQH